MRIPNIPKTETIKELMDWIMYDWDYNYTLNKDKQGNFYVNKLYIEPKFLTYKMECSELGEGLFEKVEKLYKLLKEE